MSTKRNIVANVGGRAWAASMSFLSTPFFIKFLGIEAYGLIGFYVSLLGIFLLLDMGLSTTISRELARLSASGDGRLKSRQLLRSLEFIYWVIAIFLGLLLLVTAPSIASKWLNLGTLSLETGVNAIRLMGLTILFRWPVALYTGALMGLRRHDLLNIITAFVTTIQNVGALLILWLVSPTIQTFFLWQTVASALLVFLLAFSSWRLIPEAGHRPKFDKQVMATIFRFSAGVSFITLLSVILMQLDKVVLSRILPLDSFGRYTLAFNIASLFTVVAGAVYGALLPTFSHLAAEGRVDALALLYHKSCQLLSLLMFPAGAALIMFSEPLLGIYLQDSSIATHSHLILSLLTIGNLLLAIMMPPLALQLAYGWVRLSLIKNLIAVSLFVPLLIFMATRFQGLGAAVVWILLTVGYVLIEIPFMHRRLLPAEKWPWYLIDIGIPAALSIGIMGIARAVLPAHLPPLPLVVGIGLFGIVTMIVSALALPEIRAILKIGYTRLGSYRLSGGLK